MTTLCTLFGFLPLALAMGEGAEVRSPMAITVIGGLLVSTLLTLLVIPVVYDLLDRRADEYYVKRAKRVKADMYDKASERAMRRPSRHEFRNAREASARLSPLDRGLGQ